MGAIAAHRTSVGTFNSMVPHTFLYFLAQNNWTRIHFNWSSWSQILQIWDQISDFLKLGCRWGVGQELLGCGFSLVLSGRAAPMTMAPGHATLTEDKLHTLRTFVLYQRRSTERKQGEDCLLSFTSLGWKRGPVCRVTQGYFAGSNLE